MPKPFESIKKAFAEGARWVVLEGIDPSASHLLFEQVRRWDASAQWVLLEESRSDELRMEWRPGAPQLVVVDALHCPADPAAAIKHFLKSYRGQNFVFLLPATSARLDLPSFYGKGVFLFGESLSEAGSETQADGELLRHACKLKPTYALDDLVLGPLTQLKFDEALAYIRSKKYCEDNWGFRKRHSRGHGVTVLFHGASGTGKTMAAEVMAAELAMPLYQVDLSALVSKWVGETEKNLKAVFRAAEGVRGILLFDEADAIFGTRGDVKSSQDRYANMEVNYLLQEMERFNGILLLSTNHFNHMDPAFLRRFSYTLTFGAPVAEQRKRIWERNVPSELPLAPDVDFRHLSEFGLTGGSIKNSIRLAAGRAAANAKTQVGQEDFLWAIKRELQKHDLELSRETVGEVYWKKVAPEWEFSHSQSKSRKWKLPACDPTHELTVTKT